MGENRLIRSFVAIDIPMDIKTEIYKIISSRAKKQKFIRSTAVDNYHITIKFLGNISLNQIENIKNILFKYNKEQFILKIKKCNYFNSKQPKVLWLSFENSDKKLIPLVNKINTEIENMGFKSEQRRFIPHITIARLKLYNQKDFNKVEKLISYINLDVEKIKKFKTEGVKLYKSTLLPEGAKYTILWAP